MPLTYKITKSGKTIFTSDGDTTNDDGADSDTISKAAALLAKAMLKIRAERSMSPASPPTIYQS